MSTVGFIGGGNMAFALVNGLATSLPDLSIRVADPELSALHKYSSLDVTTTQDNAQAAADADAIVLAVKPQVAKQVVSALPALNNQQLLISIAAGINTSSLLSWSNPDQPIVRCMPNTPALVQQGATALFANPFCSDTHKTLADGILSAVGQSIWVQDENHLDAVTAVSGSGPAYFFLLMEAMVAAGVELGLSEPQATQLTLQTAMGAAVMAQQGSDTPATLRHNVTSPGGTTAAALQVMQDAKLPETITSALHAASRRAAELAEEFGN